MRHNTNGKSSQLSLVQSHIVAVVLAVDAILGTRHTSATSAYRDSHVEETLRRLYTNYGIH
jgi:hypothetical protein